MQLSVRDQPQQSRKKLSNSIQTYQQFHLLEKSKTERLISKLNHQKEKAWQYSPHRDLLLDWMSHKLVQKSLELIFESIICNTGLEKLCGWCRSAVSGMQNLWCAPIFGKCTFCLVINKNYQICKVSANQVK